MEEEEEEEMEEEMEEEEGIKDGEAERTRECGVSRGIWEAEIKKEAFGQSREKLTSSLSRGRARRQGKNPRAGRGGRQSLPPSRRAREG
eukprot:749878-Hanusia_phi.AAC.1